MSRFDRAVDRYYFKAELKLLKAEFDAARSEKVRLRREIEKRRGPLVKKKSGRAA